jgi:ankyrin repeat protein
MNKKLLLILSLFFLPQYNSKIQASESKLASHSSSANSSDSENDVFYDAVDFNVKPAEELEDSGIESGIESLAQSVIKSAKNITESIRSIITETKKQENIDSKLYAQEKIAESVLRNLFTDHEQMFMYISANKNNPKVMKRIEKATDSLFPDKEGNNLLMIAIQNKKFDIIDPLLTFKNHTINQINTSEYSALTLAIKNRNLDVIEKLLKRPKITFTQNAHVIKEVMDHFRTDIQEIQDKQDKEKLKKIYNKITSKLKQKTENIETYSIKEGGKGQIGTIWLRKESDIKKAEQREESGKPKPVIFAISNAKRLDKKIFSRSASKKESFESPDPQESTPSQKTINSTTFTIQNWSHDPNTAYENYKDDYENDTKRYSDPTQEAIRKTRRQAFKDIEALVNNERTGLIPAQIINITRQIIITEHSIVPLSQFKNLLYQCPEDNIRISSNNNEVIPFIVTIRTATNSYKGTGRLELTVLRNGERQLFHSSVIFDELTLIKLIHEYAQESGSVSTSSGYASGSASSSGHASDSTPSEDDIVLNYGPQDSITATFKLTYKKPIWRRSIFSRDAII